MKKLKHLLLIALAAFMVVACEKEDLDTGNSGTDTETSDSTMTDSTATDTTDSTDTDGDTAANENTMPETLTVDIPDNLSSTSNRAVTEDFDGKDTYELLKLFVGVAEGAATVVDEIAGSLHEHKIDRAMDVEFVDDADGRTKHLVVEEDQAVDGVNWDLKLTITDVEAGDTAIQVMWNKGEAKGVAILHPYVMNKNDDEDMAARYKVDYAEGVEGFDARMIVEVMGTSDSSDEWSIDNLKIYVGKKGDEFVLYGNSNHPHVNDDVLSYLAKGQGLNYAFVAKSNTTENIAVAQIALPPSTLVVTDGMMEKYSVDQVLFKGLAGIYHDQSPLVDTTDYTDADWATLYTFVASEATNLGSPAYFDSEGFISAGDELPQGFTAEFADLSGHTPFSPKSIKDLMIKFQ